MAAVATLAVPARDRSELSPGQALRVAWCCWLMLLSIPALVFLIVMWRMMDGDVSALDGPASERWFLVTMAYLAIAVPSSFFLRSHVFKAYWSGQCVSPRSYLKGMLTVWLAIEIGGIMALLGCLLTDSLLPNLLPAMVAFILFIPFWPSGRAMTRPCGHEDDPENYEEPR
jgi:hypothetical protein